MLLHPNLGTEWCDQLVVSILCLGKRNSLKKKKKFSFANLFLAKTEKLFNSLLFPIQKIMEWPGKLTCINHGI